jgi:hypothetical protein
MRLRSLADLLAPRRPRVSGANSSAWSHPPRDPSYDVEVPFTCAHDDGRAALSLLNKARVTQCALSRICGVCGSGLDRPIAFVGTSAEDAGNAFHFPPLHVACAERLVATLREHGVPVPGQPGLPAPADEPVLVECAAFEIVRPAADDRDRRLVLTPVHRTTPAGTEIDRARGV